MMKRDSVVAFSEKRQKIWILRFAALTAAVDRLEGDASREAQGVLGRLRATDGNVERFTDAYCNYYWPVQSIDDSRLRNRQVGRKRTLAIRELALGIEALERFVR